MTVFQVLARTLRYGPTYFCVNEGQLPQFSVVRGGHENPTDEVLIVARFPPGARVRSENGCVVVEAKMPLGDWELRP